MKVVVAGGYGLIGAKLVARLRMRGHEVVAASRRSGVDTLTGNGLDAALEGAQAVVDVTNAPSFDDPEVMDFFLNSTQNLLAASARAGVAHHLALSVVGTPNLPASPYFRAKDVQEKLVLRSHVPHTLVRATQFFEFMASIIPPGSGRDIVHLSSARVQPVAADDVAERLVELVEAAPSFATVEIAGPETWRLNELVQWVMYSYQDDRPVIADLQAPYYGAILDDRTLTPDLPPLIAPTTFKEWLDSYLAGGLALPQVHHPSPLAATRTPA